jgi:predicted RNA-binding protein with PIN domain
VLEPQGFQPLPRFGRRRRLRVARRQERDQQHVAHRGAVDAAHALLAGEIDRKEFLVDQDARDEDDRAQVEQVDQRELLADREAAQPTREDMQNRELGTVVCGSA